MWSKVRVSVVYLFFLLAVVGCATTPETSETAGPDDGGDQGTVYAVGQPGPAGGIVFYEDTGPNYDWTYLEAAPEGWSDGAEDPVASWGEMGLETGASAVEIGAGADNTATIAVATGEFAAVLASRLALSGFDDWYLPSRNEVAEMYAVLFREGVGGLAPESYWTSTERNPDRAMAHNFDSGGQISARKVNEYRVRPIRAF